MAYGKDVQGDSTIIIPEVGIVENCKVEGNFILSEDSKYADITISQPNGSKVKLREWDGDTDDAQELTDKRVKHLCTKLMKEEDYKSVVNNCASFTDFINKVNKAIATLSNPNSKLRGIFIYNKKGYVTMPRYPNYLEIQTEESTKLRISDYDKASLVRPEQPKPDVDSPSVSTNDIF
jgi:hypothetical protein